MADTTRKSGTPITLGTVDVYLTEYSGTVPEHTAICVESNLLARTKSGATITYTMETYTAEDDRGYIKKTIITKEDVEVSLGLLGWRGDTLAKLAATARTDETSLSGFRKTKIGGIANDNGKSYVLCLHHIDKKDGDCWWVIVGKNGGGFELAFKPDAETNLGPTFKAEPMDDEGTLVTFIEQITTQATAG